MFYGENKLGKVNVKRDIFQEDSLSPLLLVVALISVTIILRTMKQGYSFGKEKERLNNLNDSIVIRTYSLETGAVLIEIFMLC